MPQDFVGPIQRYCDVALAAQTIIVTLPGDNNANDIKSRAKLFGEELVQKKIAPGTGLSSYLEALKAGAALPKLFLPEKKEDGEPEAGDEPAAKRQKLPLHDGA